MENFLNQMFSQKDESSKGNTSETSIALDGQCDKENNESRSLESCSLKCKMGELQANVASGSEGRNHEVDQKGTGSSKSKKNKKGRGGRKRK